MIIPKEHGAWFMLFGPIVAGIAAAKSFDWAIGLLVLAAASFFVAHAPIMTLLTLNRSQPESRKKIRKAIWVLSICLACGSIATLILLESRAVPLLILIGSFAIALEVLRIPLIRRNKDRGLVARCAGICSLTSSGPATYYVLTLRFDPTALLLWIACILYFVSSVFYVRMRVDSFSGKGNAAKGTWLCGIYHLLLLTVLGISAALNWIPLLIATGFVPVILRAFWAIGRTVSLRGRRRLPLHIKRLGFAEAAYTTFFIMLLSIGV